MLFRSEDVFVHARKGGKGDTIEQTFLAVRPFLELSETDVQMDPYRKFRAGGCLYYDEFALQASVISPEEVICHVSRTPMSEVMGTAGLCLISKPCVHIKRLDRVGVASAWVTPSILTVTSVQLLRVFDKLEGDEEHESAPRRV